MTSADASDWRGAWCSALDELELEVERAEAMLRVDHIDTSEVDAVAWRTPALPPIPPDMVERARIVHARQLDVAARMTRRLGELGRQSALADRMDTGRTQSRPVLLDQAC